MKGIINIYGSPIHRVDKNKLYLYSFYENEDIDGINSLAISIISPHP